MLIPVIITAYGFCLASEEEARIQMYNYLHECEKINIKIKQNEKVQLRLDPAWG
jgi:hypothetical protein